MLLLLITLIDGSQINMKVDAAKTVQVDTKYGVAKVPWADFRELSVGAGHCDDEPFFQKAIAELGDDNFKARVDAEKRLHANYRQAYKFLVEAATDANVERSRRAGDLLRKNGGTFELTDMVTLKRGGFEGTVTDKYVTGHNECLGEIKLRFSQIEMVKVQLQQHALKLPAGSPWVEVGYVGRAVKISATGTVNLWPTGQGYEFGPDGGGVDVGGYPNGALLGRINGKTFLVGANFSSSTMRGTLELRVNGAPESWNPPTAPTGQFDVEVK